MNEQAIPTITTLANVPGHVHQAIAAAVQIEEASATDVERAVHASLLEIASHWDADQRWCYAKWMAEVAVNAQGLDAAREAVSKVLAQVTDEYAPEQRTTRSRVLARVAIQAHKEQP